MSLNADTLSDLLVTQLEDKFPRGFNKLQRDEIRKFTDALAEAIVSHFVNNAQITVTTTSPISPSTSLQRLPATLTTGTPTDGPAVTVNLAGTGTGTLT